MPIQKDKGVYLFNFYKNKILKPSENEIKFNPRSRSAKLRVAIRSENQFEEPLELRKKFKTITDMEKYIDKLQIFHFDNYFFNNVIFNFYYQE